MTTRHKPTTPRLRFKGFDGGWEEKILGENARFAKGSGYSKSDLTTEGLPIILYGRLYTQYESIIENVDTFVSYDENALKSSGNEVIVPASGETAEDIARASAVYQKGVIFGGDLNVVTPNKDIAPSFLALTLTHGKSNQELSKKAQGKSVVHLRNDDLKACEISFPTLPEQTRLGNFFRELDHRITQSRALWEKNRQLKKAMLAKMFPAAGETAPKIRFKGFTGEWERKTLGEVVEKIKSYPLSRNIETSEHTGFKYIHYGDIHRGIADIIYSDKVLPNIQAGHFEYLKNGDVIVADVSEDYEGVGAACVIDGSLKNKVVSGLHTIAIRPCEINHLFLYYLFKTQAFKQYGRLIGTGTKVVGITANSLMDFQAYIPTHPEEQTAIGNFFRQLDDTIALYALETEKLGYLKKALLAAMLV